MVYCHCLIDSEERTRKSSDLLKRNMAWNLGTLLSNATIYVSNVRTWLQYTSRFPRQALGVRGT